MQASVVGLGCNNFGRRVEDLAGTRAVVDASLEAGVTFLDTADVYGDGRSEELLGQALEGRRDEVVLATKFGYDRGGAPEYVREALAGSLRRLRTDRIDLYQYHRPDPDVPIGDTLGAMSELVDEGLVRAIGCSNFSAAQLREAAEAAQRNGWHPFVSVQNEYNLLERGIEADVVPEAERLGMAVIPYFPLASGLLTGKYRRGEDAPADTRLAGRGSVADDATFDRLEALAEYASRRGVEPIDVAIGALIAQPAVASVIAGATKPDQVRRNAQAASWAPTDDDLRELDRIFPRP
ncbi:MAG TPA: aldo/keto reductase [Thermoleophilaceae bacterium]|nr:aldo/keto reductase [Thermoleophilaceae bacterium]